MYIFGNIPARLVYFDEHGSLTYGWDGFTGHIATSHFCVSS